MLTLNAQRAVADVVDCSDTAAIVELNTADAQRLADFVSTINSMPLIGSIIPQTDPSIPSVAFVKVEVDTSYAIKNDIDAFDVAKTLVKITQNAQQSLDVHSITAKVCFPSTNPESSVGTIGP